MQLAVVFAVVVFLSVTATWAFQPRTAEEHHVANTLRVAQLARSALTADQQKVADDWVDTACGVGSATCLIGAFANPLCDASEAACAGKAIGEGLAHLFG